MNVNYITDRYGKQSAVVVLIDEWNNFLDRFSKMKKSWRF